MHPNVTLAMVDGTRVVVPDSLDLITPYVLREQQDWFEDEIRFLRRLLQPGQHVLDIGANYGLYTLSIARTVGPSGHVWAFEPATATASLLRESIRTNDYEHVTLEQCALSGKEGTAQFSMNDHAEMNALVHDEEPAQSTESVRLITLDGYMKELGGREVDFIKIDAEGAEIDILKGGKKFFSGYSPLVQYEIMEGKDVHLGLVQAFSGLGYESYRLVPGLDILVPFNADEPVDIYQLNLFACKPDCAARLASQGWLVPEITRLDPMRELPEGITHDVLAGHDYDWRMTLATLPYGKRLGARWERGVIGEEADAVEEALALYALSRDGSRTATERFCALDCAFHRFRSLVEDAPGHPRLASLARIARDHGARGFASNVLSRLCSSIIQKQGADLDEPFLAPGERFDSVDPGEALGEWLFQAAGEELERLQSYSSIYKGIEAKDRLEQICRSRFASPDMHRRLGLVRQRFGLPES